MKKHLHLSHLHYNEVKYRNRSVNTQKVRRNKLLEEYLDTITNMENYADGIIVIDDQAKVIYIRQFKTRFIPVG